MLVRKERKTWKCKVAPLRRSGRHKSLQASAPASLLVRSPPAVSHIAALAASVNVGGLHLGQSVRRQGLTLRLDVNFVEPRRVQPEYLRFVFFADLLVPELV